MYSCLYAAHQRHRAVLLLVVKKERPVRKAADKVIAPVLLDNPVLSYADIIPKLGCCINFTVSTGRISATAEQLGFNRIWELIILAGFRKWLGGNRAKGLLPEALTLLD